MNSTENMNSTELFYNYTDTTSLVAALLTLIMGVFGMACNLSVVYVFYKEKSDRTSFNLICSVRAVSNTVCLAVTFLAVFVPITLLGYSFFPPALESALITVSQTLYLGNEYQIVVVATNRLIALFLPRYYSTLCSNKATGLVLFLGYGYRAYTFFPEVRNRNDKKCFTLYSTHDLSWVPAIGDGCQSSEGLLAFVVKTFVVIAVLNLIILLRITYFYLKTNTNDQDARRRIKKNIFLFFQTVLQDSLYFIDLTFTFHFSLYNYGRFWTFVCGTLVWECLHSVDGFIMVVFNERLSVLRKFCSSSSSTQNSQRRVFTIGLTEVAN